MTLRSVLRNHLRSLRDAAICAGERLRLGVGFLSFLLLTSAACRSASEPAPPVERVADDPEVRDAKELGELLLEATGACADFRSPITIQMPGISRGVCTLMGDQIDITVFTGERRPSSGKGTLLLGTNWTIIGSPAALEIARQALGGSLHEQPDVRN